MTGTYLSSLSLFQDFLEQSVSYCEAVLVKKEATSSSLVLKFLTELCLLCDPRALDNATISLTPASGFTFDLCPLQPPPTEQFLRRRTLRSSKRVTPPSEGGSAIGLMLVETLELGLRALRGGGVAVVGREPAGSSSSSSSGGGGGVDGAGQGEEFGGGVLERLWCASVCLQYAR